MTFVPHTFVLYSYDPRFHIYDYLNVSYTPEPLYRIIEHYQDEDPMTFIIYKYKHTIINNNRTSYIYELWATDIDKPTYHHPKNIHKMADDINWPTDI